MVETVAPETQTRGRADAPKKRPLFWFVALAAVLHLPLTPLGALVGLLALLHLPTHEPPPDTLNAIPVALLSPEEMAAMGATAAEPPPEEKATPPQTAPAGELEDPIKPPEPKPKPKPKPRPKPVPEAADAGAAADAGSHEADAGPKVAPLASAAAPAADAGPAEHPKTPADPMALVGKAASVADPNANVKLLLLNDRIRTLPIGPRIGKLVSRLPQWRSFFGPSGLDPVRDIDRMYVAGPQFRSSSEVVAVMQYGVTEAAMHKAIDGIVNREPKGEWFDTKIPAARARADRAERVFVLLKGKMVLMVPPHLKDDAIEKGAHLQLPKLGGDAAAIAVLAKPWRALLGLNAPLEIPRSIASATLTVIPSTDGGAVLRVVAVDESKEAARDDAALLTRAINVATQRDVGALGALLFGGQTLSLIEPVELTADGATIRGDAHITPRQLERIIGFAEAWVDAVTGVPGPALPPVSPVAPTSTGGASRHRAPAHGP